MKVIAEKIETESSSSFQEQMFSIHNLGMVFDILRNKLYSDPIQSICREITSNARDAHREIGKHDLPIEISLPNNFSLYLKIKDFGPGISPERISDVFIKYTASTKREDNHQIGGFGIGCKSPFAYSDTFSVTTIFNNIKYNYVCFIDETKVGKLSLISSEETEEENQTEISIPVLKKDIDKFIESIEYITTHWVIKPIIKGCANFKFLTINKSVDTPNWLLSFNKEYSYHKYISVIIDDLEYHVDYNKITNANDIFHDKKSLYSSDSIFGIFKLYLKYNTGDLDLQASRESIYYSNRTIDKIYNKLILFKNELFNLINNSLNECDSYKEACRKFMDMFPSYQARRILFEAFSFTWKTYSISDSIKINNGYYFFKDKKTNKIKIGRPNYVFEISIIEPHSSKFKNKYFYLNDIGDKYLSAYDFKKIKLFDDDHNDDIIYIFHNPSKLPLDEFILKENLGHLEVKNLSEIITSVKPPPKTRENTCVFFKYNIDFSRISFEDIIENNNSNNTIVYCELIEDKYSKKINLSNHFNLNNIIKYCEINNINQPIFYGAKNNLAIEKIKKFNIKAIYIDEYIENLIKTTNNFYTQVASHLLYLNYDNLKLLHLFSKIDNFDFINDQLIQNYCKLINLIKHEDNNLYAFNILNYSKNKIEHDKEIEVIKNNFGNPKLLEDDIFIKYPMLKHINTSRYIKDTDCNEAFDYVNLVINNSELKG